MVLMGTDRSADVSTSRLQYW